MNDKVQHNSASNNGSLEMNTVTNKGKEAYHAVSVHGAFFKPAIKPESKFGRSHVELAGHRILAAAALASAVEARQAPESFTRRGLNNGTYQPETSQEETRSFGFSRSATASA